uniref:ADAMTS like 5 n=1 Tax=Moschus moschiferus TaxID=68415 RepID=A0A8C6DWU9_MOSMO
MGKLRPEKEEHLAPCHTRRPCSLWNLLLLLWTFLNCGLGGNAQVKGDIGPRAAGMGTRLRCGVSQPPLQADCASLSPSRVRVSGHHGVPGVGVPALVGEGSQCAAGDVSGFQGKSCAGGTPMSTASASSPYVLPTHLLNSVLPEALLLPCSSPQICLPLYQVLSGLSHPLLHPSLSPGLSPRGHALSRPPVCPLQWPPRPRHPEDLPMGALLWCTQPVRPQLPSGGARLLSQLRPRARRYPLQSGRPGTLRGWPLPRAFAGYWNVTLIPEGARHIRAAHRSRNHLALMGGDGRYVLNGNWAVSPAGTYEAAGTHVVYTRATGPEETLRAAGPTSEDLLLQVLLQEPNPGIEFEFWLPRERYGPFQAQAQVLGWSPRQPQPRELEPQPLESPTVIPPRTPIPTPEPCPPCPDTRGRAHRLLHYCGSDFVFRARVLGRVRQAQETRYEVRVQLIYKNHSPLRALEYVWAPSRCPCPPLALHRDYLLAAQRLISPDGTQDRLLLPHAGYARLWSPAEDSRVRLAARHCPL